GHFNPKVDDDGVSRRVPMLLEFEGAYYEPLSLAMVRTYLALKTGKFPEVIPGFAPERFVSRGYGGLEWLKVGPLTIPVDETASALIPYRGHKFSFPYLSLTDVIKDRIKPDAIKGKIALIGTTAPGLQDLRSTPVQRFPRRGDPCQSHRRDARPRSEAEAAVHARRRGGAARHRRRRARGADPDALRPVGDRGGGRRLHPHRGGGPRGLAAGRAGIAARRLDPHDGGAVHDEHGVRLFRRIALQAPVHRPVRPVRAARAGGQDGRGSPQIQYGAAQRGSDDPVLRRARLHRHFRGAQARRAARVHQRIPYGHEHHHP